MAGLWSSVVLVLTFSTIIQYTVAFTSEQTSPMRLCKTLTDTFSGRTTPAARSSRICRFFSQIRDPCSELRMQCPECGADVSPKAKFCTKCGAKLNAPPPPAVEDAPGGNVADGPSQVDRSSMAPPIEQPRVATPVRKPVGDPPAVTAATEPELEIRFIGPLQVGASITLEGRVRWPHATGRPFLEVECPALTLNATFDIEDQTWTPFLVDLQMQQAGGCNITFRTETDEAVCFQGQDVLAVKSDTESGPNIHVTNMQSQDHAELGGMQKANINVHVPGEAADDRSSEFRPIALRRVAAGHRPQSATTGVKRPWSAVPADSVPLTRLSLRIRSQGVTRNVCLLGGTQFSLGKQRGRDIVLRLYPKSPEGDRLWRRISREHAQIEFTSDDVMWRNGNCSNGTVVDGRTVGPEQCFSLPRKVQPANAIGLACTRVKTSPIAGNEAAYDRFCGTLESRGNGHIPQGPLSAVCIRRTDNLSELEEYVVVQRGVWIGSDSAGIRINSDSVCPHHAAIIYNEHGFWLEATQTQSPTTMNGRQIPPHRLVRLAPGMAAIQVGDVEIGVHEPGQYFLDVDPL